MHDTMRPHMLTRKNCRPDPGTCWSRYQFYRRIQENQCIAFEKDGAALGRVSDEFVRALFRRMGHLAKTDGRVSEDEIRAARLIMHRLGLSPGTGASRNWLVR